MTVKERKPRRWCQGDLNIKLLLYVIIHIYSTKSIETAAMMKHHRVSTDCTLMKQNIMIKINFILYALIGQQLFLVNFPPLKLCKVSGAY